MRTCARAAAIIPLGPDSHRGSSSLPEGCHSSRLAPQQTELSLIEPGRLSPPIWPCTTRGFPCLVCRQTSGGLLPHRFTLTCAISFETSCRLPCLMPPCSISPAVLFSVALSVSRGFGRNSPDVIRRVAHGFPTLRPETSVSGLSS